MTDETQDENAEQTDDFDFDLDSPVKAEQTKSAEVDVPEEIHDALLGVLSEEKVRVLVLVNSRYGRVGDVVDASASTALDRAIRREVVKVIDEDNG